MADFTIPDLTTAVVGFASTLAFIEDKSISNSFVTENLICYLDSSLSKSYPGTGSVWSDLSNIGNDAILSGPYSYSDYSLVFSNGGKGTISNNSSFNVPGDFAIECFIFMTQTPDSIYPSALVSSWADFGSPNNKFILYINSSGNLIFEVNGESNRVIHPNTINLNQWYHIVVSRIGGVIELYINGIKGNSLSYPSPITPILDILIGSYSASDDNSFVGKLPLVRIYNGGGLTSDEVIINGKAIAIDRSNTISVGDLDSRNYDETSRGWLTGRRPNDGQVFPRGVYNK